MQDLLGFCSNESGHIFGFFGFSGLLGLRYGSVVAHLPSMGDPGDSPELLHTAFFLQNVPDKECGQSLADQNDGSILRDKAGSPSVAVCLSKLSVVLIFKFVLLVYQDFQRNTLKLNWLEPDVENQKAK
jgi:hypothetical protein